MSITSLANDEIRKVERPLLLKRSQDKLIDYTVDLCPKYNIEQTAATNFALDLWKEAEQPIKYDLIRDINFPNSNQASNALDTLVKYIPTESITLYVAAVSATPALKATLTFVNEVRLYWFFVVLTPLLFILIYAGKRASLNLPPLPSLKSWPWWKLIAATIAFVVWALVVPTNPYIGGPLQGAVAGFAAILVSTFLSLLAPIFDKQQP
jgi:hypothetical protein